MRDMYFLLIAIVIILLALFLVLLIINRSEPKYKLPENRKKNIGFKDGVNIKNNTLKDDNVLNDMGQYHDTVVVRRNVKIKDYITLSLCSSKTNKTWNIRVYDYVDLGRAFSGDKNRFICISNNTSVSKNHCRIFRRGGNLYLTDNNSKYHTYVNGNVLRRQYVLKLNDRIRLGAEAELVVKRVR